MPIDLKTGSTLERAMSFAEEFSAFGSPLRAEVRVDVTERPLVPRGGDAVGRAYGRRDYHEVPGD